MIEHLKTIALVLGYLATIGGVFAFLWKQWKRKLRRIPSENRNSLYRRRLFR